MKPRKRMIETYKAPTGPRIPGNWRNKYSANPLPQVTPEQFDAKLQEVGSLKALAKHFDISESRLYQLARRLFPGRQWRTGPGRKFTMARINGDEQVEVYRLGRVDEPDGESIEVHWDRHEQVALCQLCMSARRANSSSCVHARSVRRYVLEGRVEQKALRPCEQCPWTQKGQPDLTNELRQAAVDGKWFCCHIQLSTCIGAANYGRSQRGEQT